MSMRLLFENYYTHFTANYFLQADAVKVNVVFFCLFSSFINGPVPILLYTSATPGPLPHPTHNHMAQPRMSIYTKVNFLTVIFIILPTRTIPFKFW